MKKKNIISNVANVFGFGYTKEELDAMDEKKKSRVKFIRSATLISAAAVGTIAAYVIGRKVGKGIGYNQGKEYKDGEFIGIYNSGANDMFYGIDGRWDKVTPAMKTYMAEHITLLKEGIIGR